MLPLIYFTLLSISVCAGGHLKFRTLTPLPEGKLEDNDQTLRTSIQDSYENVPEFTVATERHIMPSMALKTTTFRYFPFTTKTLEQQWMKTGKTPPESPDHAGKFQFAKMFSVHKGKKRKLFGLHMSDAGESAYWLPKGGCMDIPRKPDVNQPKYVFTPDFNNCSWTVTEIGNDMYRIRHVEHSGEFNSLVNAAKGGNVTYAIQMRDYYYTATIDTNRLRSQQIFVFMHFDSDAQEWKLKAQHQIEVSQSFNVNFDDQDLPANGTIEPRGLNQRFFSRVRSMKVFEFAEKPRSELPILLWSKRDGRLLRPAPDAASVLSPLALQNIIEGVDKELEERSVVPQPRYRPPDLSNYHIPEIPDSIQVPEMPHIKIPEAPEIHIAQPPEIQSHVHIRPRFGRIFFGRGG